MTSCLGFRNLSKRVSIQVCLWAQVYIQVCSGDIWHTEISTSEISTYTLGIPDALTKLSLGTMYPNPNSLIKHSQIKPQLIFPAYMMYYILDNTDQVKQCILRPILSELH